jgi:hypothetical protein
VSDEEKVSVSCTPIDESVIGLWGEYARVTPAGSPELDKVTLWGPPEMVMVTKPGSPATTLADELLGDSDTTATKFAVTVPVELTVAVVEAEEGVPIERVGELDVQLAKV